MSSQKEERPTPPDGCQWSDTDDSLRINVEGVHQVIYLTDDGGTVAVSATTAGCTVHVWVPADALVCLLEERRRS